MRKCHPVEQQFGMEFYSTDFDGIGGRIKRRFEDFIVEEITPDKKLLSVQPWPDNCVESVPSSVTGDKSRFVTFTVQKMGLSTIDVSTIIAAELKIPRQHISYAGLKDKRAVTTQAMSIPSRVANRLTHLKLARISIRDPHYTQRSIQIGDLWGNRFTIRLRETDITCVDSVHILNLLVKAPLLNYFGVQRFGVIRPYTHLVGKALVKNDYEQAVRLILTTTSEYDSDELTEARKSLAEDMAPTDRIISAFPEKLRYERLVLRQLVKSPGDYTKAFLQIPPKLQTLFVHAYQSYLFNRLISERMKRGHSIVEPEPGDFIIQLDVTHTGRDSWLFVSERTIDERLSRVHSGHYGLAAPVPGYSTKTPPSWQTDLLMQILKNEDITLADFRNTSNIALDSAGGLHLVSIKPHDLELNCVDDDIIVRFSLRKGSYATVVMREIMKNHPINRI